MLYCVVDMFEDTIKIMAMTTVGNLLLTQLWRRNPQSELNHEFVIKLQYTDEVN